MSTQTPEFNQPPSTNLRLEQQFYIEASMGIAEKASKDQLLKLFRELVTSYLSQKNYYEALLKHQWGIDNGIDNGRTEEERTSKDTND